MRAFDDAFVAEAERIIRAIPADRQPAWGRMSAPQMFAHMVAGIGYSLGKIPETPNEGGLLGRIIAPIFLSGYFPKTRGLKAPQIYNAAAPAATADELVAEVAAFRKRLDAPDFAPPPHPFFGDIGKAGWARLHIVHLEHHLRQFGAPTKNFIRG